eukprot:769776-Pleurochrysis_carterae.AAC.1
MRGRGKGRPRIWQDVSRGDGYVEQVNSATGCKLLLKESPGGKTTSKKRVQIEKQNALRKFKASPKEESKEE